MSLLSFVKEAGEKLLDLLTPGNANASEQLKEHISKVGLGNPNVQATVDGDKVTVTGQTQSALAAQATDPFSGVEITDPTTEEDLLGLLE